MGTAKSGSPRQNRRWYTYLLVSMGIVGGLVICLYQTSSQTWMSTLSVQWPDILNRTKVLDILNRTELSDDIQNRTELSDDIQNRTKISTNSLSESIECPCDVKPLKRGDTTLNTLKLRIDFLNVTTEQELRHRHPNMPIELISQMSERGKCQLMPTHFSIKWANTYWQEAKLSEKMTFYAYSAFYDNRTETDIRPCVRILGVSTGEKLPSCWCQLWFGSTHPPVVSKVQRVEYLDYQAKREGREMPYLVSCPVPPIASHLKPEGVSLVSQPCEKATNLLQVTGAGERKASAFLRANRTDKVSGPVTYAAAVCGPALYYYHQDFSYRLLEWLETLKSQGISQVFLYETDVHPNIQKVLRYYENIGFIQVIKYSYPPPYLNEPSIRRLWTEINRPEMFAQENVYFTDCLLRHMHEYRFIAHYDPDEVPVLIKYSSYTDLVHTLLQKAEEDRAKKKHSLPIGYQLQWNIFFDDVQVPNSTRALPDYLYVHRHILRPKDDYNTSPGTYKTLYDMDTVTGVFSHGVLVCARGDCPSDMKQIPPSEAYLAHFTWTCGLKCQNKSYMKEENILLRHREKVQFSVESALKQIKIL